MKTRYKNCGTNWAIYLEGEEGDRADYSPTRAEEWKTSLGIKSAPRDNENEMPLTQAVQHEFDSYFNHGATSGEFEWIDDDKTRGYFWTTPTRLLQAMTNKEMALMLNDAEEFRRYDPDGWEHACKNIQGGFLPTAKEKAQKRIDDMESMSDLNRVWSAGGLDIHELGDIHDEVGDGNRSGQQTDWNQSHRTIFAKLSLTKKL